MTWSLASLLAPLSHANFSCAAKNASLLTGFFTFSFHFLLPKTEFKKQLSPIKKVPQTLKEAKKLIEKAPELTFETVCEGYSGHWHEITYGNINKRWLLLRSEQATKREILNLDKRMLKQSEKARKDFKKLKTQEFACLEGAQKAVVQWKKDFDF